ncbi:MAG: TonB-dependent receptor [Gracilimonas sp.]
MNKFAAVIILWICVFWINPEANGQFVFQNEPLIHIITEIQANSPYRFLYRESQVAYINLSFNAKSPDFLDSLKVKLLPYNIHLNADTSRKQIVLYQKSEISSSYVKVSGQVVDGTTGERLPYATLYWQEETSKRGVASNASGVFKISAKSTDNNFSLSASYLGYESNRFTLDVSQNNNFEDITIRLHPETVKGNDIVVTGFTFAASSDSLYRNFVNTGVLNPFGENNTTRALQSLPSVSNETAVNNGVNIRGSSSDATNILLDGITIYNQSHLFGLLDSFNPNALQTSGFFYDVTPAQFPATPGGTLSMITKTGSLNDFNLSAGLSNTALNATLHGPLIKGKSSWLFSGRTSYLNTLNWFYSDQLISYGLNIDRPKEILSDNLTELESRLVFPGDYDASFYDLHGKLYFEYENGSRLIASAYLGGDDVSQHAERLVRQFNPGNPSQRFNLQEVETQNEWGNFSSSIAYKSPINPALYSHTLAAVSIYTTDFSKDDFVYNRVQTGNATNVQVFTYPLRNKSVFNELKFDQSFDLVHTNTEWTFGMSYQYFMGEYFEESFDRPGFFTSFESGLFDFYSQMDYTSIPDVNIHLGTRLHYYSNGDYLHFSPRVKLKFFNEKPVSLGLGYSRNFQFVHRLSFYNVSSPDVWITSTGKQPPTSSDYFTAGFYIRPLPSMFIQLEGYYKQIDNARLFDINTESLTSTFLAPPWLYDNDAEAKGIEILMRNNLRRLTLTNSYTLSKATFQNPVILDGEVFYAEWDRTHSFNTTAEYEVTASLKVFGSFTAASGAPNRLYFLQVEDEERLNHYQRVDAGVEFETNIEQTELELKFSVFNLLNRQNTWYRELNLVIDNSVPVNQRRLTSQPMDVYDLGIQPSFSMMVWF